MEDNTTPDFNGHQNILPQTPPEKTSSQPAQKISPSSHKQQTSTSSKIESAAPAAYKSRNSTPEALIKTKLTSHKPISQESLSNTAGAPTKANKTRSGNSAKLDPADIPATKPRSVSSTNKSESPEPHKPRLSTPVKSESPPADSKRIVVPKFGVLPAAAKPKEDIIPEPWLLNELTEEQKEKINFFRNGPAAEAITPEDNDLQIVRWLTARKWDITESSKMFIESKKWRKTENIDTISEWIQNIKPYKFLIDYFPCSFIPEKRCPPLRTRDGYLVIYESITEMHPDILDIVDLDDMVKFHLYIQELVSKELKRLLVEEKNDSYAGVVYVQDLATLTMSHLCRSNYHMFQVFTSFDAANYPETIRRVFMINAPSIFTMAWKVAKNFLDPNTIKKIVILGNDYQKELLSVIPPESLPKAYGGTLDFKVTGGGPIKGIKKFT